MEKKYLEAQIDPLVIDSLHKNDLTVNVTLDDKKNTLNLKRGKDKKYWIDYPVSNESQFITLNIQTSNQQRYTKTIILDKDYIDLQFLPESGELVHGLPCKLGFKALDASGQATIVQGDIVDENDSLITSFKSNKLGMGSFVLSNADSSKRYFARMKSTIDDHLALLHPLPRVASIGNTLSVSKQGENILIIARSNYLKNDSVFVRFSHRGRVFYEKKVRLDRSYYEFILERDQLPEGIISFTLLDSYMQTVAERLYFNEKPESRLHISLAMDKNVYVKRELSKINIKTIDSNGLPVKSNLSILAINDQELGKMQTARQNILSWFLLDSELKGEIEHPGYYFNNDSSMHDELDALMLTQGWRKYKYAKPSNEVLFEPETSLTVSGHVSGVFSTKKNKQAGLLLFTHGKSKNIYSLETDSLGKFKYILDDEYGEKMNAVIRSSDKAGKVKNFTISLNENVSPPVNYIHLKNTVYADSTILAYKAKDEERNKIDEAFPLDSGYILIEEVKIKGYKLTPLRKQVMKEYGKPDLVIDGEAIQEKEQDWSYGLYSVLLFNFPEQLRIHENADGILYASIIGADITLIVIDGIPARIWEYPNIPYIPPGEVTSFEIIRCARNFRSTCMEVFGVWPDMLNCGGIIAIYTRAGKGIYGATEADGVTKTTIPVFSAPRQFYAPKYENLQHDDWRKPDLRALIHWEPILKTDSLGNANASFYNADKPGKMKVIVEAISEYGEIGYKEIEYEVEGKENKFIIVN